MIHPSERQHAADVADHYDELDTVYREVWGEHVHHGYWRTGLETPAEATRALTSLVAEKLGVRAADMLCDIGCGYGASAEFLAECFAAHVTGLSLSAAQIAIAQNRVPRAGSLHFVRRNWMENLLPSTSFDGAFAIESSEHMEDKNRFFSEAQRVLRPDGKLVVCAWLASERPSNFAVRHLLEPICREGRLPSMGSQSDYEAMAGEAGLDLLDFADISARVARTWTVCAGRLARRLLSAPDFRRMAFSPQVRNRSFLLSVPRLMLALRSGATRYGVFVWRRPVATPAASIGATDR